MSAKLFLIIQARMTSSRLPSKVMLPLCGRTVLEVMLERLKSFKDKIIIATNNDGTQVPIVNICKRLGVNYFEGSTDDVLNRYYNACKHYKIDDEDILIRLTSDCPLLDPTVLQQTINYFLTHEYEFVNSGSMSGFPRGFEVGVFKFKLLKEAYFNASSDYDKEHVTPYIKRKYIVGLYQNSYNHSTLRLTLDEEKDYICIKMIYEHFNNRIDFTYSELINMLLAHNDILKINRNVEQTKEK